MKSKEIKNNIRELMYSGAESARLAMTLMESLELTVDNFSDFKELEELTSMSIDVLVDVQKLYLDDESLTSIPDSIGNLINLRMLDLQTNGLVTIPDSMCNLKKLMTLDLCYNPIEDIPEPLLEIADF